MNKHPGVTAAQAYARDVVAGKIIACKWVRLACQRHLKDLERAKDDWAYRFDPDKAERAIKFIQLLPHTKGKWALGQPGKPGANLIVLEPWQKFIIAVLFGWVRKLSGLRRFRTAYICVPRKNGKSAIAAGIGLFMFCADGEHGAEVYSGATSEKQAWEVFRPARLMAQKTPALLERFGIQLGAKNLHMLGNGSRLEPVIGKPGDGASPSCAIVDEYHEHDTDELFDTMQTGMGAREQPLMLVITTAGSNIAGPCHALQGDVQKVLNGVVENDELFGIVYTIDEGDDWTSEAALRKANPNYDVSVGADFLASRQREAVQNSRKQSIFKTKHLNVWVQARDAWMNMEWWNRQADPDLSLDQFKGEECVVGLDLSAKLDLASTAKVFKRVIDGSEHFYVFGRHYLPETTAEDPEKQHYTAWVADGHLIATDGEVTDFAAIEADLGDDIGCFQVAEIAYDPWGATQLAQRLQAEHGATVVEFPQNTKNLSEPMKWAEALVKDGRLHHDGDPVLTWAVSNVTAKEDANENVFPRKERAENKIDPAVAMIMALGRAMAQQGSVSGSYLERDELLVL